MFLQFNVTKTPLRMLSRLLSTSSIHFLLKAHERYSLRVVHFRGLFLKYDSSKKDEPIKFFVNLLVFNYGSLIITEKCINIA